MHSIKSDERINIDPFIADLMDILKSYPEGIKEFDLIKELEKQGIEEFTRTNRLDVLELFRSHFFLFHILYRLKDELAEREEYNLSIHCLKIKLSPYLKARETSQPVESDPLREYYLDLRNLEETDEETVNAMLDKFWLRFFNREERAIALRVLGLHEGCDFKTIKRRFRQLARECHPDVGGDPARFREISKAMETLTLWK